MKKYIKKFVIWVIVTFIIMLFGVVIFPLSCSGQEPDTLTYYTVEDYNLLLQENERLSNWIEDSANVIYVTVSDSAYYNILNTYNLYGLDSMVSAFRNWDSIVDIFADTWNDPEIYLQSDTLYLSGSTTDFKFYYNFYYENSKINMFINDVNSGDSVSFRSYMNNLYFEHYRNDTLKLLYETE